MRLTAISVALLLGAGSANAAQPAPAAPAPPLGPPKAFAEYGQPDITPGLCKSLNPAQTQCTLPAMTAGRYVIEASGTSTADGAEATQAMAIVVGSQVCGRGANKATWAVKSARSFKFDCAVLVLSDRPVLVTAVYQDAHATKDPKGPVLTFRRLPWDGVLSATPFVPKQ